MHTPKKSDLHLNRFGVFPLLFMAMMICAFLWAPSVHAEEVPTTKTNYLTNDTYKDLGFSNLNDPAAFSSTDTSDPLEGYTPYTLSELFVGQMNQNDDMADWTGNFKIFENVLTTENGSLNLNNMAKNLVGSVRDYWDMRNDSKMETQCKSTVALKPGNLTDADAATRPDVIIDNTLYCEQDTAFRENDSAQMLIAWSKNANGDYERGYGWSTTLDSGHWVGNIEASQQQGYLGMTVGDFDHDNYNEVAVYSPQDSGGKILFFRLELQSDQVTYRMYQEDYSISLSSLSSDFNLRDDVKRALVQLTTSQLSGQDELVINVSMPYDNDANACKDGAIAIYDLSNTQSIKRTFFDRLSDGQTRFKSNAAVQGDVNGDGVDELIVTGNKNTGFSNNNKKGKGTISRNENLANILLWDKDKGYYFAWDSPKSFAANEDVYAEFTCNAPQALTSGRYSAGSSAETIFCEGVYYHFAAGEGKTAAEILKNGTFTQYASENFHFADEWEELNIDPDYGRALQPFIAQAVTASFVEDSRMTEQTVILSGTDARYGVSSSDMVDLDIFWMYNKDGKISEEKTNPQYVDEQNEDDNGTLITLCALNTDNDSVSLQYEGKDVGWSDPAVQSVILTPPYWSELDYGSLGAARGSTTYDVTVSNAAGVTNSNNIGLSLGLTFSGGVDIFGNGGKLGVNGEIAATYAHTFQTTNTHTSTISFTTGGGTDYVCLTITPVAMYNYNVYMPEHTATEEEIEASGGTISAGDRIPAANQDMVVSVQLNPVSSAIPLDTYNRVIENYNQNETDENYKLKTIIDVNELYPGLKTGDPTTYAADVSATNADPSDTVGTQVSTEYANIGMTGQSIMGLSMSDAHSETATNGYTVNLKGAFTQTVQIGVKFLFFDATSSLTFSEGLSTNNGQTWSTTNSTTTRYAGTFPALPASAQTGTTVTGDPSSAYSFSTRLAKWDSFLSNAAPSINMENGDTVNNKIAVIGYLVEGTDGAPPAQPTDLRVMATTENSAVLTWTNPTVGNRHPASYKVYYAKSLSDTFQPVKRQGEDLIVDAAQSGCLVTELNADTTYYFRLQAYSGADATLNKSVLGPYATGKTKPAGSGGPVIDTPPQDIYAQVGDAPFFTIAASSSSENAKLTYQWQQLKMQNYGISFVDVADTNLDNDPTTYYPAYYTNDSTITPSDVATLDQSIYRCVVTETKAGNDYQSITSRCATLHIGEGKDTSVTLAVPESQEAVLSYDTNDKGGTTVTVKSDTAFNLDGQLTTATPDNQDLRIHVVDNASQTQLHLLDTQADATTGAYSQPLGANDLAPGTYTLITTYGGDGDNAASYSNIVDLNVLDSETKYTITYNLDGGTNSINNPSLYTAATGTITLEAPTKYGATFEGWYRDAQMTQKLETIDCAAEVQDITLYAKWTNIPYAITYNLDGGTNASTNPATFTVADTITLDAPTKDGFTFEGWYKDAELTQPTSGISQGTTGDQSFYTKWSAIAPDIPAPVDPDAQGDYPISNYDELVAVANAVAADPDRYATANYYLTGNIIASEKAWNLAIGSEAKPFIGQFDGRNYYILGLVPGTGVRGLFDTIGSGGTVSNLSVIDMDFSDTVNIVGGIAAINKGTIDGCGSGVNISSGGTYFKDGQSVPLTELNSTLKGEMAGGLVGDNQGTILNSRNNAIVMGGTTGGIAGRNTGTIANVFNTGAITASTSGGGIVGTLTAMGNLSHGYNVGTLTANGELTAQSNLVSLGAIAGTLQNANVVGFYYANTMANAYGDPQSTSLGAVAMEPSAMATQAFTDQLNSDITDLDLKAWTWRASDNGGYPRIEKTVLVSTVIKDLHLKVTDDEPTPSPSTVNPSAPSPGGSGSSGASGNGSTPASTLSGNTATGIAGGGALAFVLGLCLTAAATIILYRRKEVKHDK